MALSKPMQMLAAASAAGVGGFMATSILYPLDTIKTRLQSGASLFGDGDDKSGAQKKTVVDVLRSFYRGYQYKAAESTTSKFLYFYAYTLLAQIVAPPDGKGVPTATNLAIGYLSEFAHLPLTLPMEVIATRLQTGAKGASGGVVQIIRGVFKESGAAGFYKGFQAYFVLCLQPAIQYTVFERVKEMYLRRAGAVAKTLSALEAFLLGALARSIATLLLFPYIRAKVLVQSKNKKKHTAVGTDGSATQQGEATKEEDGIVATLKRVVEEEGPLALYTGLTPELTKGALSSALMLMIKEKIQAYITFMLILASMQASQD